MKYKMEKIICFCLSFLIFACFINQAIIADDGKIIEEKILAEADKDIDKYRKSDAIIEVVDSKGNPIKDAIIKINQKSSDFLFAANVTLITGDLGGIIPIEHYGYKPRLKTQEQENEFKKRFAELFNCATIPLYWRSVEPERDKPDYSAVDRVLEWCSSQSIKVKGHTLVWIHGDNDTIPILFENEIAFFDLELVYIKFFSFTKSW